MTPLAVAGIVSSFTLFLSVLFVIEKSRGRRYFPRVRALLDEVLGRGKQEVLENTPTINRAFFLHTFHYLIHKILSFVLRVVARFERGLRAVVHFNRTKAKERMERINPDSHLQKIAEHKEEVALSQTEKEVRKKAALMGDSAQGPYLRQRRKR